MLQYASDPEHEEARKRFNKYKCIKRGIYVTSSLLFIICLAAVASCVYMFVEWSFLDDIMDYDIPSASMWMLILAASFSLVFIPITGCSGARRENKCLLLTNVGMLCAVFVMLIIGAIFALVWQGEIGDWVSVKMEMSLKEYYGVNLDNRYNQLITQQWDKAQIRMSCCGIRREGSRVYRQTRWFNEQPYIHDSGEIFYGWTKPMVPESCCRKEKDRIYNLNKCQRFGDEPPAQQGEPQQSNDAINREGCYFAAMEWVKVMAGTLLGIGIGIAVIMMAAIFLSLGMLLLIRD